MEVVCPVEDCAWTVIFYFIRKNIQGPCGELDYHYKFDCKRRDLPTIIKKNMKKNNTIDEKKMELEMPKD